jgi:hypothetical protein
MHNAECIMKENAEAFWIIKLRKKISLPYAVNLNVSGAYKFKFAGLHINVKFIM